MDAAASSGRRAVQYDRFIPFRSAMDLGYAQTMLTNGRREEETPLSPTQIAYRKSLAEALNLPSRILAFRTKPPPVQLLPRDFFPKRKVVKAWRPTNKNLEGDLDAPDLDDDHTLNLLDWGSTNILAIGIGVTVFLRDASTDSLSEFDTVQEEVGSPITSISWAPDGRHLAVGLANSNVQLWDLVANRLVRTLEGGHKASVGSLAWNDHILTTGDMDGKIINNDSRVSRCIVGTYRGHHQEVCGLKWSASKQQLASGGNDKLLYIWDVSSSSSNSTSKWLHKIESHTGAVRALAWCPFQRNFLASGGSGDDRYVKFWDTQTGACFNSFYTGSEVCALVWGKNKRELLSSHGLSRNQLTLRQYPSMEKMAEFTGHTSRVLYMTQSPDGCRVASAGGERVKIWNIFEAPVEAKQPEPFASSYRIGIR